MSPHTAPDHNPEPHDTSLEEQAQEQAIEDAWSELLNDGWLPSGEDVGAVMEAYMAEDQGEMIAMLKAYREGNQANMTSAAYKVSAKLETIAKGMIDAD